MKLLGVPGTGIVIVQHPLLAPEAAADAGCIRGPHACRLQVLRPPHRNLQQV